MHRAIARLAAALLVAGCARDATRDGGMRPLVPRPLEGLSTVMHAKLDHVHALLDGITLHDMGRVADSADRLASLSEQSEWQVHTTLSYTVMSERFRTVARAMAEHARAGQADAVSADYQALTASCLDCHAYLRREGLYPNLPPRAERSPPDAAAALAALATAEP
jgi:hypothetical protein